MSEDGEDAPDYHRMALNLLRGQRPPEGKVMVVGDLLINRAKDGAGLMKLADGEEFLDYFKPHNFQCGLTLENYLRYWDDNADGEDAGDGDEHRPLPEDGGVEFQ